jgi:hypothetical protein
LNKCYRGFQRTLYLQSFSWKLDSSLACSYILRIYDSRRIVTFSIKKCRPMYHIKGHLNAAHMLIPYSCKLPAWIETHIYTYISRSVSSLKIYDNNFVCISYFFIQVTCPVDFTLLYVITSKT